MKNHESLMAHYKSQIATLKCDLEKKWDGTGVVPIFVLQADMEGP